MNDIPRTMRAVVLTAHGGLEKLDYREDWPTPVPGPGEVLVAVAACGLNNFDINVRTGWYSKPVTEGTTEEGGRGGFKGVQEDDGGWRGGVAFPRIQGATSAARLPRSAPDRPRSFWAGACSSTLGSATGTTP